MKIKHIISTGLLSATLLLAACGTTQNYQAALNSWEGAPATVLVEHWGEPNQTQKLANGNHVYIYEFASQGTYPAAVTPGVTAVQTANSNKIVINQTPTAATGSSLFQCTTYFEINSKGRIINAESRGNDCVATKGAAQRKMYWR